MTRRTSQNLTRGRYAQAVKPDGRKTFANHLQPEQLLPLCRLRESSSRSFQSKSSFRPQNNEWMRDAAWLSPSLGGGGLSPPWKTHWTGSIHQILSIIHSFNLITAAAQPSRRTTPHHAPPRAAPGSQNRNSKKQPLVFPPPAAGSRYATTYGNTGTREAN